MQKGRAPISKCEGFTLVELLVVISIIVLLVSILSPSLHKAMVIGRRMRCATNLRGCGTAIRMYLNENGDTMPVAAQMPSLGLNEDPSIALVLQPYLDVPEILLCPADSDETYFRSEGSSYEYHTMLGGQQVGEDFLTRHWGEDKSPVMNDYKPFHGRPGKLGSSNYLFVDGHVGDLID
jgi:prepilin-type N-terminal cleavage/methylation domain-containing protein/prepilin-type processing-associated H-X9-DG protein